MGPSTTSISTQVEREKLRSHEDTLRLNAEKGRLDRTLTGAELDLAEAQQQIQQLEVSSALSPAWSPIPILSPRGPGGAYGRASTGAQSLWEGVLTGLESGALPMVEGNTEAHWYSSL